MRKTNEKTKRSGTRAVKDLPVKNSQNVKGGVVAGPSTLWALQNESATVSTVGNTAKKSLDVSGATISNAR
jgi:hypothetical protein